MKYRMLTLLLLASSSLISAAYDLSHMAKEYIAKAEQYKEDNNIEQAMQFYKNAISVDPNNFMLIFNTANLMYAHDYKEDALHFYDKAIQLQPHTEQIYFNKGIVLTQLNEHEKAADCFMQALNTNENYEKAYIHAGHMYKTCNKLDQAMHIYKRGLELFPNNADLHYRYAIVLKEKDLFEPAIDQLRVATSLAPDNLVYKLELANALHLIDGSLEALELYEEILEHNPNNYHVLYNFGYTLKKMGFIERAIEVYERVLEFDPNYSLARFSRSISYLTLGDFVHGWPEYEWRWAAYNESSKKFDCPVWDGFDIQNKRILLYAEQGLGDTAQFIRYAELVKARGAHVIVQTQGPLKDLLQLCPYIDEVYKRGEILPSFDTHIALMSLPMVFGTTVETVPDNIPYLYADEELTAYWKEYLSDDPNFKIGICWQGNPNYRTQFLRQAVAGKSMHVKHFSPIARLEGVTLYNLQKLGGEEQLDELDQDVHIVNFGDELDTTHGRFMDTVAIMKNLDLVICIDTGTCHVAAALGIPVWNLLPNPADWRWMIDRSNTPWYKNMRLIKQPTPGDWAGSIEECLEALQPILQGKKTVMQVTQEQGHIPKRFKTSSLTNSSTSKNVATANIEKSSTSAIRTLNTNAFDFESLGEPTKKMPLHHKPIKKQPSYKKSTQNIAKESPEAKVLTKQRAAQSDLNTLTAELISINKQLWEYDKQLKEQDELSLFDDTTMQQLQKIVSTYQKKIYLKNHIKQLARDHYHNNEHN